MTIKEIRKLTGLSQKGFAEKFNIPKRTIQEWEQERREPPDYVIELLEFKVKWEELNMYGEFTLRNFLNSLSHDIECTIVTNNYTEMAKTILKEEYIALDDMVTKWDFEDCKLLVWL